MKPDPGSLGLFDLIVIASVFGLVLGAWLVAFFVWHLRRARRSREIEGRLGLTEEERGQGGRVLRLWHEGREVTTSVPGKARRRSWKERMERLAQDSELGSRLRSVLLGTMGLCALGSLLLFTATGSLLPGAGLTLVIVIGLRLFLRWKVSRRLLRFERQFVDALDLAARSLHAGHPLLGAFRLIADEIPPPVSTVFDEVCQRQSLGMSLEDALRQVSRDHPSHDLRLFVTSVIIQMKSGGNLADMMERIALVIRDRLRLGRKVRTLTAQTQLSKRILIGLPFIMFFALNVLNPKYMSSFYNTSEGHLLLAIALGGILVGTWVMNKIAVLRY